MRDAVSLAEAWVEGVPTKMLLRFVMDIEGHECHVMFMTVAVTSTSSYAYCYMLHCASVPGCHR